MSDILTGPDRDPDHQEIARLKRELAGAREELARRTASVVIHNGMALACSEMMAAAYDEVRAELRAAREQIDRARK